MEVINMKINVSFSRKNKMCTIDIIPSDNNEVEKIIKELKAENKLQIKMENVIINYDEIKK